MLKIKKLSENAILPKRMSKNAAGYDLYAAEQVTIEPMSRSLIKTDIAIEMPPNTCGRILSRSSWASKLNIDVAAGIIDQDYTGNICVLLVNNNVYKFVVNKGERIAQLVLQVIVCPEVIEVRELSQTIRGEQGFGSTGKN